MHGLRLCEQNILNQNSETYVIRSICKQLGKFLYLYSVNKCSNKYHDFSAICALSKTCSGTLPEFDKIQVFILAKKFGVHFHSAISDFFADDKLAYLFFLFQMGHFALSCSLQLIKKCQDTPLRIFNNGYGPYSNNQSGGIKVALKTHSLYGKHTECGAKDQQH